MLRQITPNLSRVPTDFLLKEIARRSRSAVLSINWKTIDSPGDYETRVYAHGKRCEVAGLLVMSGDAIGGDETGSLESPDDFPNPPDQYEAILALNGPLITGLLGEG